MLAGYAAVWDSPSEGLAGFTEYIRAGAFTRTLREKRDVVALVHHDPRQVLGRTTAGTLRLNTDHRGLAFEIDLPETTLARDLLVSVERGDVTGASFAFTVPEGGERWTVIDNEVVRELVEVNLREVTITPLPIYPDTNVARRALAGFFRTPCRLALALRFLETI